MKNMIIGLMRSVINNVNMGCVALSYCTLHMLELISKEIGIDFKYIIFETEPDEKEILVACEKLSIDHDHIVSVKDGYFSTIHSSMRHLRQNITFINNLKSCDLVIDFTEGDSFTDIYGQKRFDNFTNIKIICEKLKIPLILGPQTYGPFNSERNKKKAQKAIEAAYIVMARDNASAEYINKFSNKKIYKTTDIAFSLPYNKNTVPRNRINIGINVSGLLISNPSEKIDRKINLKLSYDQFIKELVDWIIEQKNYDIHFIPHVGNDANDEMKSIYGTYPNVYFHNSFSNPIDAKNEIAKMDIFFGARMHSTIGAFSAGVATIPTAYSRKFTGLFNSLGYPYIIDMTKMNNEEALEQSIKYINSYKLLREKIPKIKIKIDHDVKNMYQIFLKAITQIGGIDNLE